MPPFGLAANSKDRSFPYDLTGSLEIEGSSIFLRFGEGSGVLSTLVLGVELNSEQMIEPEIATTCVVFDRCCKKFQK